ncbi:MAG: AAA family ATPase [Alphaproteobacteria bacterium]
MKIIAIISQKGGAGKTTMALHLAVASELSNQTAVVIDLDPQASATSWKDSRPGDTPMVVSAQSSRLAAVLDIAEKGGAKICIIDTAPHSESAALAASRSADLILIPCRPAILDLRAISNTIELARIAGKPVAVVLNSVPSRGSLAAEAVAAVAGYGVDVVPVQIGQRAAFTHALTVGQTAQEYEPTGKAADEVQQLYMWTCKHLRMLKNE